MLKETLIYSSSRRMPGASALKTLDPGMRRDDDKGINQSILKLYLPMAVCILFSGNLYATTPANDEQTDEKQLTPQQVQPVDNDKLPTAAPAVTFTPSEKVGADSAVSFPVDI